MAQTVFTGFPVIVSASDTDGVLTVGSTDISETEIQKIDESLNATLIGAVNASVTGTLTCAIERMGAFFKLTFTLTALRVATTDAAGSGSYGATKLFDFVEGAIAFLGSRVNITSFTEGAALDTSAGDIAFVLGLGTTAISSAADGSLGSTVQVNIGASQSITASSGTGAGEKITGPGAMTTNAADGTATALDINLNWSGTAATSDANSTIDFTGTITVIGVMMGDD